jgi:hypothetical protein
MAPSARHPTSRRKRARMATPPLPRGISAVPGALIPRPPSPGRTTDSSDQATAGRRDPPGRRPRVPRLPVDNPGAALWPEGPAVGRTASASTNEESRRAATAAPTALLLLVFRDPERQRRAGGRIGDNAEADATWLEQVLGARIDGTQRGEWREPGRAFASSAVRRRLASGLELLSNGGRSRPTARVVREGES